MDDYPSGEHSRLIVRLLILSEDFLKIISDSQWLMHTEAPLKHRMKAIWGDQHRILSDLPRAFSGQWRIFHIRHADSILKLSILVIHKLYRIIHTEISIWRIFHIRHADSILKLTERALPSNEALAEKKKSEAHVEFPIQLVWQLAH